MRCRRLIPFALFLPCALLLKPRHDGRERVDDFCHATLAPGWQ
jgi:hypothetical protein